MIAIIIGFLLIAGLLAFRRRNTRLRLESEAAAAAMQRYERQRSGFTNGIREAIQHKRRLDDYEQRAVAVAAGQAKVKYK